MMGRTFEVPPHSLPAVRPYLDAAEASGVLNLFLTNEGSPDLAIAFAHFFWPEFVEIDGCVLFKEHYDSVTFQRWQEEYGGDHALIERMVNHTHLDSFFLNSDGVEEDAYDYLVHITARMWKAGLQEQFPNKKFHFVLSLEDEVAIYFWQVRPASEGATP